MFVFLSPRLYRHRCDIEYFSQHDEFTLPIRNCRKAVFNLVNEITSSTTSSTGGKCCQKMIVYKDMSNLNISADSNAAKLKSPQNSEACSRSDDDADIAENNRIWYELNIFVKGFKDVMVKGKTIWE